MGDLTAKCDWHGSTLSIVLPEDPERIAVRLFDSRHAPARLYVPEADALQLQAENERLRELVADLWEYIHIGTAQDGQSLHDRTRELGVEV